MISWGAYRPYLICRHLIYLKQWRFSVLPLSGLLENVFTVVCCGFLLFVCLGFFGGVCLVCFVCIGFAVVAV